MSETINKRKVKPLKIAYITNVPFFFTSHLRNTIKSILEEGHELHLICSEEFELNLPFISPKLTLHKLRIEREISVFRDLITLLQLIYLLKKIKVNITHSYTPKAGLLTTLAAFACNTPTRLHSFTGQPWVTKTGLTRKILILCDKIIIKLNSRCYADSFAQIELFKKNNLIKDNSVHVLGHGSIAGVNKKIFDSSRWTEDDRKKIRAEFNIGDDACIINFTGRLRIEKGICELLSAFKKLAQTHNNLYLVIVGPRENGSDKLPETIWNELNSHPRIRMTGYQASPEKFYAVSHIFCIPSYREGFGSVVIETAMMGIPTVGTDTIGLSEAIVDNVTGLLVPLKNSEQLGSALEKLIQNDNFRMELGRNARQRALDLFDQDEMIRLVLEEYQTF